MFTVRQVEKKDQPEWDNYVLSHSGASPYHLWAWKESVEKAYNHTSFYFIAEDSGKVVGVFPLFNLRLPLLVNELTALPFCDVGNCLADSIHIQHELISKAKEIVEMAGCVKTSFRGKIECSDLSEYNLNVDTSEKVRMLFSLPDTSEALLASFKSKLRSQIHKAEKNGVQFIWQDTDGVDDFYLVYSRNMRDLGSPPHSKKWFHAIVRNYGGRVKIGLTNYNGTCIGAGLILSTDTTTAIPWASTLREYNKLSPNMLLYWNFLKYSADKGCRTFDFGRSTEGEGTYRFKKQWGAEAQPLLWYSFNKNISIQEENKLQKPGISSRDIVESIWKKLPVSVSNYIGPWLRKNISL